ncbi:Clp protease [uncultured Clostridium sp.]|nr:Clp protease [uncultured Clostridium sp.]
MEELLKANWDSRGSESMTVRQNGERMDAAPENKQGGQGENHDVKKDHDEKKDQELKKEQDQEQLIREAGQMTLDENAKNYKIHLLSIIGEIEGHECLPANTKTTKYEHVLPQLAAIEDSQEIEGLLVLINTVGGDVESGLAIAEMIASLSKPSVSLVLGGSHSIGVPLAVATEYSFIVPTGTMIIHPVRMTGMVIGVPQTYDYFKKIQDRIVGFIASHCNTTEDRLEQLMMETGILTKDVGTILVGSQSVDEGIINEVGGIKEAMAKLYAMIEERRAN